jgi:hypothetical protein
MYKTAKPTTNITSDIIPKKLGQLSSQEMLARGKGVIDAAKYGIYDRV